MQSKRLIFVIGPPASGKTTWCKNEAAKHNALYHGIGELVRKAIKDGKMKASDVRGYYAPENFVRYLLLDAVFEGLQQNDMIIIDGFPKTLSQLLFIDTAFPGVDKQLVVFNPPEDILLERISHRKRADDTTERVRHGIGEISSILLAFKTTPQLSYIFTSLIIYDHTNP